MSRKDPSAEDQMTEAARELYGAIEAMCATRALDSALVIVTATPVSSMRWIGCQCDDCLQHALNHARDAVLKIESLQARRKGQIA